MIIKRLCLTGLIVFACIIFRFASFGQSNNYGTIKGIIITSYGQPAPCISVNIEHVSRGSITNEKGAYIIRNVPTAAIPSKYAVGIISQQKKISLAAGQTLITDFPSGRAFL